MLNQQVASRMKRDGIWISPYYAVLDPVASAAHLDRFALVEGRVLEATQVRGRVFLNFSADYKTDFTISIAAKY